MRHPPHNNQANNQSPQSLKGRVQSVLQPDNIGFLSHI
ncbi:hypothetical protein SynBIOSE41_01972 [Synechococcus sp. BIOS-E4-1]|nr:hypothetical protein SynBIOSE41_01972 [Synechococcus sp. BIOS-E4-1]